VSKREDLSGVALVMAGIMTWKGDLSITDLEKPKQWLNLETVVLYVTSVQPCARARAYINNCASKSALYHADKVLMVVPR